MKTSTVTDLYRQTSTDLSQTRPSILLINPFPSYRCRPHCTVRECVRSTPYAQQSFVVRRSVSNSSGSQPFFLVLSRRPTPEIDMRRTDWVRSMTTTERPTRVASRWGVESRAIMTNLVILIGVGIRLVLENME